MSGGAGEVKTKGRRGAVNDNKEIRLDKAKEGSGRKASSCCISKWTGGQCKDFKRGMG